MMMKSWPLALIAALAVSACQTITSDAPETTIAPAAPAQAADQGEVLFTPKVLDRGGYCMVGFGVTYPEDVAPHSRQIRVTTLWSDDEVDYALPIPPLGAPDSFIANDDGTVTFTGMIYNSIDGCDPELAARTLAIGPCVEGDCAPARFVPDSEAAGLGLVEADY